MGQSGIHSNRASRSFDSNLFDEGWSFSFNFGMNDMPPFIMTGSAHRLVNRLFFLWGFKYVTLSFSRVFCIVWYTFTREKVIEPVSEQKNNRRFSNCNRTSNDTAPSKPVAKN